MLADHEASRPAGRCRRGSRSCRSCGRRSRPRRTGSSPGPDPAATAPGRGRPRSGNTSVTSIACGSSTTRAWPGSAPAPMVRSSLSRCSVPARWLPSRILIRVARQPGGPLAAHGRDDRPEGAGGVPDQFRREARLGAVELVVDGPERDAERLGVGLVGGVDGGLDVADDGAHQVHDRGEQQGAGVLPLGGLLEQGVDGLGGQGVLQGGTGHDGDGALLGRTARRCRRGPWCRLRGMSLSPGVAAL